MGRWETMSQRSLMSWVVVLLLAPVSLLGAAPAAKMPAYPTFGPPTEGTKIVLGETSIDGPAFWTNPSTSPKAVIAWTGVDSAHRLNVMTSDDGLHYANKHILPELSLWRPAVAFDQAGRGAPYGNIAIGWTGVDSAHTLNVEYLALPGFTVVKKFTFQAQTSFTAPAVAFINDNLYLAWAGTDSAHTLNTIHISRDLQVQEKHTFWGWNTISRPDLSMDFATSHLLMAWTNHDNRIAFAETNDSGQWVMPSSSPLVDFTPFAPTMIGIHASNMPVHWVAWNGAGEFTNHRLFVRYTPSFPDWQSGAMASVLGETAISGPELGYVGIARQMLITWTGTDTQHHLNVAVVSVSA